MSKRSIAVVAALALAGLGAYLLLGRGGGGDAARDDRASRSPRERPAAHAAPALAEPARVSGRVTGADAAPIAGAVVQLTPIELRADAPPASPLALTARTGDDGRWSLDGVAPGDYRASAAAAGHLPGLVDRLALDPGAALEGIDFSLAPGGHRLTGVVSDVTGGPIAGALVLVTPVHGMLSIRDDHSYAALTGADGRYAIQLADGRYRATARHAEYSAAVDFVEMRGGDESLDFSLTPGAAIDGVVRSDATGEPVPYARVSYWREATVAMPGGGAFAVGAGAGLVVADDRGAFRIRGLSGGAVGLRASSARAASREPTRVPLGIAEHVTGVEVYVAEAFSISGRVVVDGDDAKPAAGVTVLAAAPADGAAFGSAPSAADGAFRIDGVPPGRYRLQTASDDYVDSFGFGRSVEVDAADLEGVTVSVDSGATITGRVEPAGIAEVRIELPRGDGPGAGLGLAMDAFPLARGSVRTREDGAFSLGPVEPGEMTLVARAGDGSKGELRLDLGPKGASGVVIQLEPRASVSGVVVDADGNPVGDAVVALSRVSNNERVTMIVNGRDVSSEQTPTHEDGSFELRGLDAGDYELSVRTRGGETLAWARPKRRAEPTEPMPITLEADTERSGLTLRVEARNGVIRGVAVGPDGSPAPDTWVTATRHRDGGGLAEMLAGAPGGGEPQRPPAAGDGEGDGEQHRVEVRAMVMVGGDDEGDGGDGAVGGFGLGGSVPPVLTDGDGRFEITGLRTGSYDLMAEGLRGTARGFERGVDTGSDTTVKLVALTRIDGTVTFGGEPVPSFTIGLRGAAIRDKAVRDEGGRFSLHRIDPGAYTIDVKAAEGEGSAAVTVVAGEAAEVAIELASLQDVTGVVVDEAGNPVAGAVVVLGKGGPGNVSITMDSSEEPTRTAQDGSFRARAAAGSHLLIVLQSNSPRPLVTRPIVVQPGADLDLGTLEAGGGPAPPS